MNISQPMKRVQVLLPQESYDVLRQLATEVNMSVSALVRGIIEEQLVEEARIKQKKEALTRMFEMELPVDDWDVIEKEITDSMYGEHSNHSDQQ